MLSTILGSTAQANLLKLNDEVNHKLVSHGLKPNVRIIGKDAKISTLQERMDHYNVPGISIAFLNNHKIVWTHTQGVTDRKSNKLIDENTVFQAASISKPVFASILMKYRQHNDLNLDIDVNTLLKSWQLPTHKWSGKNDVTLRRLLSHSAGTTVHGFAGYEKGQEVPSIISLLNGTKPTNSDPIIVDIEPGSKFRYSGGGTTVAQLVLQDQSNSSLPKLANRTLFTPLKMQHTSFSQPLISKLNNNAAKAHNADGEIIIGGSHTYATLSAAGLWTTPSDLLRLVSKIQLAGLGKDETFFTKKTIEEMFKPQLSSMGIGFFVEGENEITSFSHGGANEGFMAHLFAHNKTGDGIVIMTNGNNGTALIDEVLLRVSEIYNWNEFKPTQKTLTTLNPLLFKSILGKYKISEPFETILEITDQQGEFKVNMGQFVKDEIFYPESNKQLFSMTGMSLFLQPDEAGEINNISFWGGIKATKIKN